MREFVHKFRRRFWLNKSGGKKSAGETLLEVVIAVSMIMIIIAPTAAIYTTGIQTLSYSKEDLIAESLAEEGLELMRGFRDNNLIKFAQKGGECWDAKPEQTELEGCEAVGISDGSYIFDGEGVLKNISMPAEPFLTPNNFGSDTSADYKISDNFYREIFIKKLSWDGNQDAMKVLSRVFYVAGGKIKQIEKAMILTSNPYE